MFSRVDGYECDGRFLLAGDLRGRRVGGGGERRRGGVGSGNGVCWVCWIGWLAGLCLAFWLGAVLEVLGVGVIGGLTRWWAPRDGDELVWNSPSDLYGSCG